MNRERIKETIQAILLDHKWIEPGEEVQEHHVYTADYAMDSIDLVEALMELEKEYNVSIPDDVVERLDTVGETIDFLIQQ